MEKSILSNLGSDRRDEALANHLNRCAYCQDSVAIANWLRQLEDVPVQPVPPDPEVIWMMSRITQSSRRLTIPFWDGIAAILFAAFIAVLLWSPVEKFIARIVPLQSMLLVVFLVSCVIAAGMTAVALNTEALNLRRR